MIIVCILILETYGLVFNSPASWSRRVICASPRGVGQQQGWNRQPWSPAGTLFAEAQPPPTTCGGGTSLTETFPPIRLWGHRVQEVTVIQGAVNGRSSRGFWSRNWRWRFGWNRPLSSGSIRVMTARTRGHIPYKPAMCIHHPGRARRRHVTDHDKYMLRRLKLQDANQRNLPAQHPEEPKELSSLWHIIICLEVKTAPGSSQRPAWRGPVFRACQRGGLPSEHVSSLLTLSLSALPCTYLL